MFIPGFKSIDEFAAFSGFNVTSVYRQLKRGYCKWPRKTHDKQHKQHPSYNAWNNMHQRCYNRNSPEYGRYGGRGITVCTTWIHNFPQFVADMGIKPDISYSLDRIDNNKGYSKENCRWATKREQVLNRRPYNPWAWSINKIPGYISYAEFARVWGLHPSTVGKHMKKGSCSWPFDRK